MGPPATPRPPSFKSNKATVIRSWDESDWVKPVTARSGPPARPAPRPPSKNPQRTFPLPLAPSSCLSYHPAAPLSPNRPDHRSIRRALQQPCSLVLLSSWEVEELPAGRLLSLSCLAWPEAAGLTCLCLRLRYRGWSDKVHETHLARVSLRSFPLFTEETCQPPDLKRHSVLALEHKRSEKSKWQQYGMRSRLSRDCCADNPD